VASWWKGLGTRETSFPQDGLASTPGALVARCARAGIETLAAARATTTWLAIVTATWLVLEPTRGGLERRLLVSASTNLHNLSQRPLNTLITSACFVSTRLGYFEFLAACLLLLAPLERLIGTWRWLLGLAIGHGGATLLVAAGLWLSGHSSASESRVMDVGVSYGVLFLVTLFTYCWAGRRGLAWGAGLVLGTPGMCPFSEVKVLYGSGSTSR
jgi:hypothetical protein